MHGAGEPDAVRDRLAIPVAVVITAMWLISGIVGLITGDLRVFLAVNVPFGGVWGYTFTVRLVRRATNGNHDG